MCHLHASAAAAGAALEPVQVLEFGVHTTPLSVFRDVDY
jgi:hypothetical protein